MNPDLSSNGNFVSQVSTTQLWDKNWLNGISSLSLLVPISHPHIVPLKYPSHSKSKSFLLLGLVKITADVWFYHFSFADKPSKLIAQNKIWHQVVFTSQHKEQAFSNTSTSIFTIDAVYPSHPFKSSHPLTITITLDWLYHQFLLIKQYYTMS